MGRIKKLKETDLVGGAQSTDVYPITSTLAVYDGQNKVLESYLTHLRNTATFGGIATPTTNPGTPTSKVFYIANGKGTYTNFGGLEVTEDDVVVLYWDSSWHKVSTGIACQEKLSELLGESNNEVFKFTDLSRLAILNDGTVDTSSSYIRSDLLPIKKGETISFDITLNSATTSLIAFTHDDINFVVKVKNTTTIEQSVSWVADEDGYICISANRWQRPTSYTILSNGLVSNRIVAIEDDIKAMDYTYSLTPFLEVGNISINTSGWSYSDSYSRCRVKQGIILKIKKGDRLKLSDNNYVAYLGMRSNDGTYSIRGWSNAEMVFTQDCELVLIVRNNTEMPISVSEVKDLLSLTTKYPNSVVSAYQQNEALSFVTYPTNYDAIIRSICHRGFTPNSPENTLIAFKNARKAGFNWVETDVQFTSDNVPVIIHDDTIDRTSDGTGNVSDYTLAQLKAFDFGSWYNAKYAGEKIPTLLEFLELCKKIGMNAYIEIKAGTSERVNPIVDAIISCGMKNNIAIICADIDILLLVKERCEDIELGLLVSTTLSSTEINNALSLRSGRNKVFIDASIAAINDASVALCKEAQIPLEAWTIFSEDVTLLSSYIKGFTTAYRIIGKEFYYNTMGV